MRAALLSEPLRASRPLLKSEFGDGGIVSIKLVTSAVTVVFVLVPGFNARVADEIGAVGFQEGLSCWHSKVRFGRDFRRYVSEAIGQQASQ